MIRIDTESYSRHMLSLEYELDDGDAYLLLDNEQVDKVSFIPGDIESLKLECSDNIHDWRMLIRQEYSIDEDLATRLVDELIDKI